VLEDLYLEREIFCEKEQKMKVLQYLKVRIDTVEFTIDEDLLYYDENGDISAMQIDECDTTFKDYVNCPIWCYGLTIMNPKKQAILQKRLDNQHEQIKGKIFRLGHHGEIFDRKGRVVDHFRPE